VLQVAQQGYGHQFSLRGEKDSDARDACFRGLFTSGEKGSERHCLARQARYPDLVMRVDYDQKQASATRRAFLERYCDTSTLCCTMHFPSPSVGHISAGATASAASRSATRT
jgi:hypothetical protein